MLLHMAAPMGIGVPYFVDGVMLSFECALAKVEGYELGGDVGYEGVAHGEEQIAAFVAGEEQVVAQGGLSLIGGCAHGVVCRTAFHPDEFPVEIKVIGKCLACLESGVLSGALGADADICCADGKEKEGKFSHVRVRARWNR